MKPVYFAHATNAYNRPIENAAIRFIADKIAGGRVELVENPNQPHHQVGYDKYAQRVKRSDKNHKGMNYFYDEVLPQCGSCVAMPYLDGRIGLGVGGEALWFIERDMPTWYMQPKENVTAEDIAKFIEDPLRSGLFRLRTFSDEEVEMLKVDKDIGSRLLVPHEETRLRSWYIYGKKERPYEEAHLVSMPVPPDFYPNE